MSVDRVNRDFFASCFKMVVRFYCEYCCFMSFCIINLLYYQSGCIKRPSSLYKFISLLFMIKVGKLKSKACKKVSNYVELFLTASLLMDFVSLVLNNISQGFLIIKYTKI